MALDLTVFTLLEIVLYTTPVQSIGRGKKRKEGGEREREKGRGREKKGSPCTTLKMQEDRCAPQGCPQGGKSPAGSGDANECAEEIYTRFLML